MIHVKDHKQYNMFNPFDHLGSKRLALLESSWAHLFREEILHKLPVEKMFPLNSKQFGRRTKELYAMLGIVLLQQQQDLTDDESIQQFSFNIMWQYALNVVPLMILLKLSESASFACQAIFDSYRWPSAPIVIGLTALCYMRRNSFLRGHHILMNQLFFPPSLAHPYQSAYSRPLPSSHQSPATAYQAADLS